MKVHELRAMLANAHPDAEVVAFDGDTGRYEQVSGMLYGGDRVELQTDDVDGGGDSEMEAGK